VTQLTSNRASEEGGALGCRLRLTHQAVDRSRKIGVANVNRWNSVLKIGWVSGAASAVMAPRRGRADERAAKKQLQDAVALTAGVGA
jgi:hypothetical protein